MDAKSKRGCLWAAVGAAILVLLVGAALFGGAAWMVYQGSSFQNVPATPERAGAELEALRARFAGQTPLIAVDEHEQPTIVRRQRARDVSLTSLHVVAFDAREQKLQKVSFPFWVLRLSPGELKIGDASVDALRRSRLTVADIEAAGPGLLLDHTDRSGARVIAWTE